ncbi:MAG: hypothetical protein ACYC4H_07335 [Desulfocucumaceae bacterium]
MKGSSQFKSIMQAVIWGVVSMALYSVLFFNQQVVMDYFTRGGFFAVPVIFTALLFSFVHGLFANFFIDSIGFKPEGKGGH